MLEKILKISKELHDLEFELLTTEVDQNKVFNMITKTKSELITILKSVEGSKNLFDIKNVTVAKPKPVKEKKEKLEVKPVEKNTKQTKEVQSVEIQELQKEIVDEHENVYETISSEVEHEPISTKEEPKVEQKQEEKKVVKETNTLLADF